jgi:hypothetical protein
LIRRKERRHGKILMFIIQDRNTERMSEAVEAGIKGEGLASFEED